MDKENIFPNEIRESESKKLDEKYGNKTFNQFNTKEFGALGNGPSTGSSVPTIGGFYQPLSTKFSTITQAQKVYPHATDLTNEIDWCAIQGAINYASDQGGGEVIVPSGIYFTNQTIVVKPKVKLTLLKGAVIKPSADVHIVRINKNAQISGGSIDAGNGPRIISNFSKAMIWLEGNDNFGVSQHLTMIENMNLFNWNTSSSVRTGTAIYFHARAGGSGGDAYSVNNSNVTYVHVRNVEISGFEKGIWLNCEDDGVTGSVAFINGNIFSQISIGGCVWPVRLDCVSPKPGGNGGFAETSGNWFTNLQVQPTANITKLFFYASGAFNTFTGHFWDIQTILTTEKAVLSAQASNTRIESNLQTFNISDYSPLKYNEIRSTMQDTLMAVIPPAVDTRDVFAGNQDDWFAFADKRGFTITQTGGPAISNGTLGSMFNLYADSSVTWDAPSTVGNPVVIEISFPATATYFGNLGLSFGPWSESPKNLKIEEYVSGQYVPILDYTELGPQKHIIQRSMNSFADKIKITFSDTNTANATKKIRIIRIFAQNTIEFGYAYMPRGGGKMYGDFDLNKYKLLGAVLEQNVTANRPTSPVKGQMFYDTTLNKPIWYNGTNWTDSAGTTV